MGTKILGPVILPETLNGASYLEFLAENLPDILEEILLLDRNRINNSTRRCWATPESSQIM